jgi:hypothetical protein
MDITDLIDMGGYGMAVAILVEGLSFRIHVSNFKS